MRVSAAPNWCTWDGDRFYPTPFIPYPTGVYAVCYCFPPFILETGEISHTLEAMAPDLRVRAVVRLPRQGRASDSKEAVDSDEEWADSAEEAVESEEEEFGSGSSSSKQCRSETSGHLQPTQSGE
ncbi:unnamed protein product [Phytophthora fragariaefolia]|uniref:Unnamed protein product n=1 Tax=Phytophthora fragariaefolia TaxID=1490495 RepID=A0A9W7CSR1_9STRA|nr:unnamed protein product [Phytophthora fragariaefolia]